jgi:hypothetical protein
MEWMIYKDHSQSSVLPQIVGVFWTFLTTGCVVKLGDQGTIEGNFHHSQGFKRGNLTTFLADVFTPNSHPIGQTLGIAK